MDFNEMLSLIPHRPPFLWLDRVLALQADTIRAEKKISRNFDLFQGHYPDSPIMPGVLLCEAVFQAGALLIASRLREEGEKSDTSKIPVLTRIQNAKFKRGVYPGDTIEIQAFLRERVGAAWFLRGRVEVNGKVAVKVDFACTLTEDRNKNSEVEK